MLKDEVLSTNYDQLLSTVTDVTTIANKHGICSISVHVSWFKQLMKRRNAEFVFI